MPVKLFIDNLKGSALKLEGYYGLSRERDVPVKSFCVDNSDADGPLVLVEAGKYKSALILLYLAEIADEDEDQFHMTPKLVALVRNYFGVDLCKDAETNPETEHTTIRDLLADRQVVVTIKRRV